MLVWVSGQLTGKGVVVVRDLMTFSYDQQNGGKTVGEEGQVTGFSH